MRERGIWYATTQGMLNHKVLSLVFSSSKGSPVAVDDPIWKGQDPAVAMEQACEQFRQEMTDLPPEITRVIVSSEAFSQLVRHEEDIARLHALLAPFFDRITVLIYLRRQDGHVASYYSQALRRGLLSRPSLAAWKDRKDGFTYDYERLLAPWVAVFGEAAIMPRVFERDTDKSWDVVADFIAATGTGPLPPPARATASQNPSISAAGQRALVEIGFMMKGEESGQAFARTPLWRRLAAEMTEAIPGKGWQPTQAEARDFVARFAAANENIRRRWLPERPRLFSDDYAHLAEKPPKPDPEEELHAVARVLLHVLNQTLAREAAEQKQSRRSLAVKRALRANKSDPAAHMELARMAAEEGQIKAARHHAHQVLRLAPENEEAREWARALEAQLVSEEVAGAT